MELDTAEAHEFLRQAAPLLQAAGFGVQLPAWAGRKGVGLQADHPAPSRASGPGASPTPGSAWTSSSTSGSTW